MQTISFIHDLDWDQLPLQVQRQVRRCLLDTLGAAIGGCSTGLSRIIHDFAAAAYGGHGAYLWLDGREVSPVGAALANGMTIDALDIHDGYTLTKGHAGAALVPAVLDTLALSHQAPVSGKELLASLTMGYELALRAGRALHRTACDYHTSGAWNALGCAAITARRLGLDANQTRHALGIAEYHGPRSQMMRCIDYPTMVKDGSGWGAMSGVSAAMLAGAGFTGAPAVTMDAPDVADLWADLGEHWLILEQYFKPDAVCRWAQPAVAAALRLQRAQVFAPEAIQRIRMFSFHEALRLGSGLPSRHPGTTEEAQYSLLFAVAAALVHGQLGPQEVSPSALDDPRVLRLADRIELIESPELNALFPAQRFARVVIDLVEGDVFDSGLVEARWGAENPPTDKELQDKFRWLAGTRISESRAARMEALAWHCEALADAGELARELAG
jgi:2-methylcitrate dehydratase PrpD